MSFWGEKLGTAPPPPSQPRINPNYLPRGMGQDGQSIQRAVNDYVSRLPGQQYQQQAPQAPPVAAQGQWQAVPNDQAKNVAEVLPIWQWQGKEGAAETARTGACPHCGSNNFFSRSTGTVINTNSGTAAAPAPECWECGYPRTQGILSGGATMTDAPAKASRQGATPSAPMGSIGRLTA